MAHEIFEHEEKETMMTIPRLSIVKFGSMLIVALGLGACVSGYPDAPTLSSIEESTAEYIIGPGDNLQVFVWRNPDLTASVPVRPDGRISVPLIENVLASGKTPSQLGDEVEDILREFVKDPKVTIIVTGFVGPFAEQIRIVGQATSPQAIPYRRDMTILDAMIQVGGLTDFAAGNRAVIVRKEEGIEKIYSVRLNDLLRNGDVGANVSLVPGDVVIIPESKF
jgi:polysaccharide biosynthesis/export protein